MKFKFSVLNLTIAITFVLAFVCILLSYLTPYMHLPAMVLFAVAFILVSVKLICNYIKQNKVVSEQQDAIIMELAMGEDGEKYVMQDDKKQQKLAKNRAMQNIERLLPAIVCIAFSVLFVYLFVSSLISLF